MRKFKLTDLIETKVLQELQDAFSEYTGLSSLTTDADGVPITECSNYTDFCMKLTRKHQIGLDRCMECDRMGAVKTLERMGPCAYRCHAGLIDFAAPIIVEDTILGIFLGGQVRPDDLTNEQLAATARELGLDSDEYIAAAARAHRATMEQVEQSAQFLYRIANVLSRMAYRNYIAIENSKRMEAAANSRSQYILARTSDLKIHLGEWENEVASVKSSSTDEELEQTVVRLADIGGKASSIVNDTIDYIQLMDVESDFGERVYSIRELTDALAANVRTDYGIEIACGIGENVPETLYGDEPHIYMILDKLISECRKRDSSDFRLDITSKKSGYAQLLELNLSMNAADVSERVVNLVAFYLDGSNDDYDKKKNMSLYGFSVIGSFIRKLSGSISIETKDNGRYSFVIHLPQLGIKGA